MRYGLIGDNPIESAMIASGLLPAPMLDGYAEMADWQRAAGLVPRKPIGLPLTSGTGLQAADKPRAA